MHDFKTLAFLSHNCIAEEKRLKFIQNKSNHCPLLEGHRPIVGGYIEAVPCQTLPAGELERPTVGM